MTFPADRAAVSISIAADTPKDELTLLRESNQRLSTELGRVIQERNAYLARVDELQERCTTQLEEIRSLAPLRELTSFALALSVARSSHPEGTCLHDLFSELSELTHALGYETQERYLEEALDVAICGLRIALGGDRREP